MLAFTQLQALTGPEGSSQCLSGLLAFTMARSVTLQNHLTFFRASSEFMRLACVQPTASTEWACPFSACQACLRSPGQGSNPTLSFEWAGDPLPYSNQQNHLTILKASSAFMRLACIHPTASTVQSVLVRPASVHHGQTRYRYFEGKIGVYEVCLQSPNCKH